MDLQKKKIFIILSKQANDDVILKAYFHSCVYALVISRMLDFRSVLHKNICLNQSVHLTATFFDV